MNKVYQLTETSSASAAGGIMSIFFDMSTQPAPAAPAGWTRIDLGIFNDYQAAIDAISDRLITHGLTGPKWSMAAFPVDHGITVWIMPAGLLAPVGGHA